MRKRGTALLNTRSSERGKIHFLGAVTVAHPVVAKYETWRLPYRGTSAPSSRIGGGRVQEPGEPDTTRLLRPIQTHATGIL